MTMLDTLRSGLKFLLMSMGISSPAKKNPPPVKPAPRSDTDR
jgi:hypothetical protein